MRGGFLLSVPVGKLYNLPGGVVKEVLMVGSIKNVYEEDDYEINLDDSSPMKGLYFQWVDTELKYLNMEASNGADTYHIGVVAFVF